MFRAFPAHHQELNDSSGSLWFYLRIVVTVVLCLSVLWVAHATRSTLKPVPTLPR
jgi:hypothetical protein